MSSSWRCRASIGDADENTKHQDPKTREVPSSKTQTQKGVRRFKDLSLGIWALVFPWFLDLGVWILTHARPHRPQTPPRPAPHERPGLGGVARDGGRAGDAHHVTQPPSRRPSRSRPAGIAAGWRAFSMCLKPSDVTGGAGRRGAERTLSRPEPHSPLQSARWRVDGGSGVVPNNESMTTAGITPARLSRLRCRVWSRWSGACSRRSPDT